MRILLRYTLLAAILAIPGQSLAADHVARSNYMILQSDETVPPPPNGEVEPSPSDLPAPKPAPELDPVPGPTPREPAPEPAEVPTPLAPADMPLDLSAEMAEGGCASCGHRSCCCLGEPWKLPQPGTLQRLGITVGGWLEHGITFNADSPTDGFNGPVATNDLDSEYQMNQLWMYLSKPADTGGCGWALGGRFDILYGTDWRFGVNKGLEDRINGLNDQTYGVVIPQAYIEVAYNDVSVLLGHFGAILDYEMVPSPFNPFYSHSYSYGYTVPQLVTGALADWQMTEEFSVQVGAHRGWMMFEDYNDDWDVMAGIKWARSDGKSSLAYAISSGRQSFQPVAPIDDDNRFVYSLVAQQQLSERLRYVLVHNLGYEKQSLFGTDAEWYGLNQYLLYKINDCWAANLRAEWLRDDDGVRVAGPGNIPGIRAQDGAGYAGNFYEITAGVTWKPHANVTFRPEIRYDWYDGDTSLLAPARGALPFDGGTSDEQLLLGVDMIVTY